MLEIQLLRRVDQALDAIETAKPLIEVLTQLEARSVDIDSHLNHLANDKGKIQEHAAAIFGVYASVSASVRTLSSRNLLREVERLQKAVSVSLGEGLDHPEHIVKFIDLCEEFAECFNRFLAHQTAGNAFPLLNVARRLNSELNSLASFLRYLQSNGVGELLLQPGESSLSLVMLSVSDVSNFASKLTSIDKIYTELCSLLNVSPASYPLRIYKIESGSLWVKVFGNTEVIKLIAEFFAASVKYFHRNYTEEGKIGAIPRKLESLDAILNFSNRLQEKGVDVTSVHAELSKSAVFIARDINLLLADQAHVEINEHTFSIGTEYQRKLLESASVPRLESKNDASSSTAQYLEAPKDDDGIK